VALVYMKGRYRKKMAVYGTRGRYAYCTAKGVVQGVVVVMVAEK
jgi:hypothetical protein